MYCGKSEELIRRIKRAEIAKQKVLVFKPAIDDRYHHNNVTSHDGSQRTAICVNNAEGILAYIQDDVDVVCVDELQFFDCKIVEICEKLADRGKRVIVAGLDRDFRGEPFGPMPQLLALAEYVDKLHAICVKCGNLASRTQRLVDGAPAAYSDPIIQVGATEAYEARCRKCHAVKGKIKATN